MTIDKFDVLGIGNAIVDVLARSDDDFLAANGLQKGTMRLIDAQEAETLYGKMGAAVEASGGSAANTIAGVASLGGKAAFIGKVKNDKLGQAFAHDIRAMGVAYTTPFAENGTPTARCLVLVTPDGERTMNTFLGASQALSSQDLDTATIAASKILYLEGYLWDPPLAKQAFTDAAAIAKQNHRTVALSLSDVFCVDRYRDEFRQLLQQKTVSLVFANQSEAHALYETGSLAAAIDGFREDGVTAVITRGEEGCLIVQGNHSPLMVPCKAVDKVVDTTGAGDLFAAGYLFGLAQSLPAERCAQLGALAASEVISHFGARPQVPLKTLAQENGLI